MPPDVEPGREQTHRRVASEETTASRAVVHRALTLVGERKFDEASNFIAPELQGVVREFAALAHHVFPDLDVTLEDTIAEGDKVVYRWSARGTHEGAARYRTLGEIQGTGRRIDVQGITILQVADGKIVRTWGVTDEAGGLEQLGLLSLPFRSS
jgi:predicted ester cyclase